MKKTFNLFALLIALGLVVTAVACKKTEAPTQAPTTKATTTVEDKTTTEPEVTTTEPDAPTTEPDVTTTEHTHSWDEGRVTTNPTCTAKGVKTYTCSCGETRTEEVEALGHDLVDDEAVAATCTTAGKTAGHHCSRCDYTDGGEAIEALGHDLVEDDDAVEPTCTTPGKTAGHHCTRCDYTDDGEEIAPTHNFVEGVCSSCGERRIVLNPFTNDGSYVANGIYHAPQVKAKELVEGGLKATFSASSWSYLTLMLNNNGENVSMESLNDLDAIVITFTCSSAFGNILLADKADTQVALKAGKNELVLSKEFLLANAKIDASGFWLQFSATSEDEYIIFESVVGLYPKAEEVEDKGVVLNPFSEAGQSFNGIYFTNVGTVEKVEAGVQLTCATAWSYIYIGICKDGALLSEAQVKSLDKLVLTVDSTKAMSRFGIAEVLAHNLIEGENRIIFTHSDLQSALVDGSGFKLQVGALEEGTVLTFKSLVGYFPEGEEEETPSDKVLLNEFSTTADSLAGIVFANGTTTKELTDDGLKLSGVSAWGYIYVGICENGTLLTSEQVKSLDKLVLVVKSNKALARFGIAEVLAQSLVEGENVIVFNHQDLQSSLVDASGFRLQVGAIEEGTELTFVSLTGYKYTENNEGSTLLNAFSTTADSLAGIVFANGTTTKELTEDGLKLSGVSAWGYIYVGICENGTLLTSEQVKALDKLVLIVDSNKAMSRFGIAEVLAQNLVEGENVIVFDHEALQSSLVDGSGFRLQVGAIEEGTVLTFKVLLGYKAE